MEFTPFWQQISDALRLDQLPLAETLATGFQVVIVALVTIFLARWTRDRIRRGARGGPVWADAASLVGQGAAILLYGVGFTIALSILGLNPTAIAAILGAATIGSSLALQDVAKGFVNGAYLLVERPFRIGDQVRIGGETGRVEEMGIRLTRLRTEGGERVNIPSTLVFTSSIENATSGYVNRRRYTMTGIERPILEIEAAVTDALKSTPFLTHRSPIVEIVAAGPDGTSAIITVVHDLGHRVDAHVMSRLRAAFPESAVTVGAASAAS